MSCPACFSGGTTASHPTGTTTTLHGLQTYIAQPEEGVTPKGVIVFITDAFGWEFANNRVLCDHYAKRGRFLVYCPDFMAGHAMSPEVLSLMDKITGSASIFETVVYKPVYIAKALMHAIPWKNKTNAALTHPGVVSFIQSLRTSAPPFQTGDLKIGVAGFCWGGKHAFMLAADKPEFRVVRHESQARAGEGKGERLVDAVFTAHPSYIDVPGDCEQVSVPMSVAVGDADMAMKAPLVMKMKGILEGKNVGEEKNYVVEVIQGAKHGFAVRTHPDDEEEMKAAENAEVQAVEWFLKWIG